jgi:hypothetical protein
MAQTSDTMCVTSESREIAIKILYRNDLKGEIAMLDGGKIPQRCKGLN